MAISRSEPAEISCSRGHSFVVSLWCIVDAEERPDLRALILLGRLNVVRCPYCGAEEQVAVPLLYHDAAHEAVLLALPPGRLGEGEIRALADRLVETLFSAIPPQKRRPYLYNVQLAGSMAGLAGEIRSWGGLPLSGPAAGSTGL